MESPELGEGLVRKSAISVSRNFRGLTRKGRLKLYL